MDEEIKPIKAHDVDKSDPEYKFKVNSILSKRFEEENRKKLQREKEKSELQKTNAASKPLLPPVPFASDTIKTSEAFNPPTPPVASNVDSSPKDPEEVVRRKDIVVLVNQLNKSFGDIQKFMVEHAEMKKKLENILKIN